jgi:NhaP-type Na+/H+ or K+/H+ antiporter
VEKKDIVIAIFGAAVGLSGVLLVIVGFVYTHAETLDLKENREKLKNVAKLGLIPFLVTLICATLALHWMFSPSPDLLCWAKYLFYTGIALTAVYGIGSFVFYL